MRFSRDRCGIFQLNFLQMRQVALQHVALQLQAGEFALAADFDQPRGFQFLHMVRQRGCSDRLAFANIGAGGNVVARSNLLQNLMPPRIGQRLRDQMNLLLGKHFLFRHRDHPSLRRASRRCQYHLYQVRILRAKQTVTHPTKRNVATMRRFC